MKVTIVIDNTCDYLFVNSALLRTYQILMMLNSIYRIDFMIRIITVHPQIKVTTCRTESILSIFNRIYHSRNIVASPSDSKIDETIDLIGGNNGIVIIIDENCVFKKEYIDDTCQRNEVIISMYKSLRYDSDIYFYQSRKIDVVRFKDTNSITSYEDILNIITLHDRYFTDNTKISPDYDSVIINRNYVMNMIDRQDISRNYKESHKIEDMFRPFITKLYHVML